MTITLELAPDEEAILTAQTRLQGVEPVDYIHRIVRHDLERTQRQEKKAAAIALL